MYGIAGTFLDDLAVFLHYVLDHTTAPAEAGFGAEWSAHSLTVQTGGLQPERGLFWHPAPGTTDAGPLGSAAEQQALLHP